MGNTLRSTHDGVGKVGKKEMLNPEVSTTEDSDETM